MPPADPHPAFGEAGTALNVDPMLLRAIGEVETGGEKDPDRAVSSVGALGRMQIMPPNLKHYNVTDPSDPRQNIHAGAALLDEALTASNGNVPMALRIYQGGPDQSKWGPQNAAYPGKVAAAYQRLTKAGAKPAAAAGPDATDAFLSGGAGPEDAKAEPTAPDATDAFLAGKEDVKAPAGKVGTQTPSPEAPAGVDIYGRPNDALATAPSRVMGEAARGAVAGFGSEPLTGHTILSPEAQAWMDARQREGGVGGWMAGLGSTVAGDIGTGGNLLLRSGNALFRGAQAGVMQGGVEAGDPQMGRDLAAIPEAFMGQPGGLGGPRSTAPEMLPGREAMRSNLLADAARGQSVPPDTIPTMTVRPGNPVPQGVGAAASRDMSPPGAIDMTPAEMKANRRQAEKADLLAPPEPGDMATHIEGSLPTKAEYSGDPTVSQRETMLRARNPNAFEGKGGRLDDNTKARINAYDNMTPSDTTLQRWEAERSAQAQADSAAILQHAKPADATPVSEVLNGILNDPRNVERESVQRNLAPIRDRLLDADGNLKTDPQALWGIYDDLTEKLDKIGKDPQSTMGYVKKETLAVKNALGDVLNTATDGRFQTFRDNYAAKSQQINAGNLLREFRDKFTNSKGEIMANRFHNWAVDLAETRGDKGIDPAMDIPDDKMRQIISLDKDLKRAGLIDLGKARGSPTDLFGTLAKGMGIVGAHAGMAVTSPGVGNLLLHSALTKGEGAMGNWRIKSQTKKHLAPPPGGYRNLLAPD